MKSFIASLMALGLLTVSCPQDTGGDKSEDVKMILRTYFGGIKNRDVKVLNSVTTTDFLLYEDGRVFNNDSLINFLNSFPSFSAEFTLDNFKVDIGEDIGHMSYYNRGDLTFNDTLEVTYNWLESASFKKVDGQWKMNFLHSTVRK